MPVQRFAPGDVVVRREVLRGEVWFGCPTVWWDPEWASWQPDPAWPVPRLPADWDAVPSAR
ncbi:hypothetical protein ACFOW4_07830 [Micromonospora sp. GCM10011542]|uniref:hypothetical protein n=1 Tax=Micromonospora sp. GCM10011542 TaxID=3317337 RepID=UPI0036092435